MRLQKLLILLLIMAALLPAWYFNKWLQQIILPRKSFGRFLLYMLSAFVFVFIYTFLVILLISDIFPIRKA